MDRSNEIEIAINHSNVLYSALKRVFDFFCALFGIIVLSPLFLIVAILIKLEDKGTSFYTQERIGLYGKVFKLYKFRSMFIGADDMLKEMLKDPKIRKEYKKNMKLENDPRITKIGHFIRKTSIDELPQLINVLKGDMSLIGNRPYLPREREDIGEYFNEIVSTKPGITGLWQTSGRSSVTFKERLKIESYYSSHASIYLDIKIFFKTIYVVAFCKDAK